MNLIGLGLGENTGLFLLLGFGAAAPAPTPSPSPPSTPGQQGGIDRRQVGTGGWKRPVVTIKPKPTWVKHLAEIDDDLALAWRGN